MTETKLDRVHRRRFRSIESGAKQLFPDTNDLRAGLAADLNFARPPVDTHNACLRRNDMPPKKERHRNCDDDRSYDDAKRSAVVHFAEYAPLVGRIKLYLEHKRAGR